MWDTILRLTTDRTVITYWYVLPAIVAVISHIYDDIKMYRKERKEYAKAIEENTSFYPSLTIGTIVGGFVISAIPVVNILYCGFGVFPDLVGVIVKKIGTTLEIHLVPKYVAPRIEKDRN